MDDIECPIDRQTINMVVEALGSVWFNTSYTAWRTAIYQDEHPDYSVKNKDGENVAAGYCVEKWNLWINKPLDYIGRAPNYRSGLIDLIEDKISQQIKDARMYREPVVDDTQTKEEEE